MPVGGKSLAALFIMVVAGVFFVFGLHGQYKAFGLMITGTETNGEIVAMTRRSSSGGPRGGGVSYLPIYRFDDASGQERTGAHSFSGPKLYEVGEAVPIIYAPEDPSQSMLGTFYGRFSHMLFVIITLPGLLGGAWIIRKDIREQKDLGWTR